jgi:23S rRNA (cytosine1962-C5)-methyltransferase
LHLQDAAHTVKFPASSREQTSLMNNYPVLRLNAKADYRLRMGHVWVYSNEIDNNFFALKNLNSGDLAIIQNAAGKQMGLAYVNPNTLICARLLTADPNIAIDKKFFQARINAALALRSRLFNPACYRLVYGESDFLPGLVVDRFFDTLVVQISTAGMDKYLDLIVAVLDDLIKPNRIIVKNDGKMREIEGLDSYTQWVKGQQTDTLQLEENGVKFIAPIEEGQKTGWFFDHRMMRSRLRDYVKDKRVLDVFSYIGGWGIQAGAFGAKQIICNDISASALSFVEENARLNNLTNVSTMRGDAFEIMQELFTAEEKFDVVILDPPAFIPRRKDLPKGSAAYQKANLYALRLLAPDGVLVSGSCSMHMPPQLLREVIHKAAIKLGKELQLLEQGHQGPDHPIHPAIPETEYLKSFILRNNV